MNTPSISVPSAAHMVSQAHDCIPPDHAGADLPGRIGLLGPHHLLGDPAGDGDLPLILFLKTRTTALVARFRVFRLGELPGQLKRSDIRVGEQPSGRLRDGCVLRGTVLFALGLERGFGWLRETKSHHLCFPINGVH